MVRLCLNVIGKAKGRLKRVSESSKTGGPIRAIALVLAGKSVLWAPTNEKKHSYLESCENGARCIVTYDEMREVVEFDSPIMLADREPTGFHEMRRYATRKGEANRKKRLEREANARVGDHPDIL